MTQVKYFHAEQTGAPTLNGVQGTLIAVLDACLVNGFGSKTVDSLVVAGNVATVNISTGHSMQPDMVAEIAGATPAGLNGEWRVVSTTSNSFTFTTSGISDQTATGTITTKVAPLGWAKVFSATNVAVYRASSVEGTRMFLRVDETADGREATVRGYENMTDASTGTGPFPTVAQVANGVYWPKATTTTANARNWTIVGDHRTVYVHISCVDSVTNGWSQALAAGCIFTFGDFKSFKAADPYACIVSGTSTLQYTSNNALTQSFDFSRTDNDTSTTGSFFPRAYTAIIGSTAASKRSESFFAANGVNSGAPGDVIYPNGPDNSLILVRTLYGENHSGNPHIRGRARGAYRTPQNCHASFSQRDKFDGSGDLAGRRLLAVKCGAPNRGDSTAMVVFDITGPWEA